MTLEELKEEGVEEHTNPWRSLKTVFQCHLVSLLEVLSNYCIPTYTCTIEMILSSLIKESTYKAEIF